MKSISKYTSILSGLFARLPVSNFKFGVLALCATVTTIVSPSHALDPIDGKSIVESKQATAQQNQTPVQLGWNGLNIQMPTQITWTSSKVTVRDAEQRACVAVGSDDRGPVELILVELNGYFAATFTDGSGVRWSARNTVGQPIVFTQVAAKDADFSREALTPSPELVNRWQKQQAAGQASNEGGIAGNCQDTDTIDVLVVYTACALYQSGSFGQLLADIFLGETITNTAFDNSAINTAGTFRQVRIVAVQPTPLYPFPCGVGQAGCQPDPTEPICGSDGTTFDDDLAAISNINTALGGAVGQMRNYHSADLVLMLRVGVGVVASPKLLNEGCVSTTAFAVIGQGSLGIESTAMANAIGRLSGCSEAPGDGGVWGTGLFPYSSGFRFVGSNQIQYHTIMAREPGFPITYFSNPSVTYEGRPTGANSQAPDWCDNARTIRETYDDIRCYRCPTIPPEDPTQGTVVCFGSNSNGQCSVPADLLECKNISAGYLHTVVIQSDGMVRAWGAGETNTNLNPDRGQSMVPVYMPVPPNGDGQLLGTCKEVAAGLYHTIAIRVRDESDPLNGTVVAWGAGTQVQNSPNFGQCIIPTNLGICKKVAAGFYHSMALKENGTVVAWGAQTTNQAYPNLGQTTVPSTLGPCIEIAAGGLHSVALKSSTPLNSTNVVAWGAGNTNTGVYWSYGQTIVPPSLGTCTKIAAGPFHTVVLQANGTVRAFGAGTTNTGTYPYYGQSIVPPNLGACRAIAAGGTYTPGTSNPTTPPSGGSHTIAIKVSQYAISAWGTGTTNTGISPNFGQCIVPSPNNSWISFAAGGFHTVGIRTSADLSPPCFGDLNHDGFRNGVDLSTLLSAWGTSGGDINGDGMTDGLDMSYLLSGWGSCP